MTDWWSHILAPGGRKDLGRLLASHPDAGIKTERLLTGLTVVKLIKIANCEFNYCRIGRDIPATGDLVGRSDRAWKILDHKVANIQMRSGTAWMRTADLLRPGSDDGLARVRALPIDRVIDVCERLIQGPYTSCTNGARRQQAERVAVRPELSGSSPESPVALLLPSSDFDDWALWWYKRLGARPESAAYLASVAAWRDAWRPKRVRALLLAESHVAQRDGDLGSKVRTDWTGIGDLPSQYVRLVYCLGYDESGICSPPPQGNNNGTWQFWNIFGQIARGENQPAKSASSLSSRLRWKLAVLGHLQSRGIWLQDASPLGLYLRSGRRVDPGGQVDLMRDGYQRWVWPSVETDNPEKVWVIGRGVAGALAGLPGIDPNRVITQPQDREPGRHLAGLARMRADLGHL